MVRKSKDVRAATKDVAFRVSHRFGLEEHEKMLVAIRDQLPIHLSAIFHNRQPLEALIREKEKDWNARIAKMLKAKKLSTQQRKYWLGATSGLLKSRASVEQTEITFGESLFDNTFDSHHRNKKQSKRVGSCDILVDLKIPTWTAKLEFWWWGEPGIRKLKGPDDAIEISQSETVHQLFGNIYPSQCRIGDVAKDLADLCDAVAVHLENHGSPQDNPRAFVLVVTDSEEIYKTFVGQYNAIFLRDEKFKMNFPWVEVPTATSSDTSEDDVEPAPLEPFPVEIIET